MDAQIIINALLKNAREESTKAPGKNTDAIDTLAQTVMESSTVEENTELTKLLFRNALVKVL